MFDKERFRIILRRIIGEEKQVAFAKSHGISQEHLSRLLRSPNIARPSVGILEKIAAGNSVDLAEMMEACGYGEQAYSRVGSDLERAGANVDELRKNLTLMTKDCRVYKNLEEFFEEYVMLYDCHGATFAIFPESTREYEGDGHFGAEYVTVVIAKFPWGARTCKIWSVIYFSETKGGRVIILDAATDGKSLAEAGVFKKEIDEAIKDSPFVHMVLEPAEVAGLSARERLINAIFGNDLQQVPYTYIGFGIDFFPGELSPETKASFIAAHMESFGLEGLDKDNLKPENIEEIINEINKKDTDGTEGFGSVVAIAMRNETGIPFEYFSSAEDGRKSAVMVERGEQNGLTSKELQEAVKGYAGELGLTEFGECIVFGINYMEKDNRFQIES